MKGGAFSRILISSIPLVSDNNRFWGAFFSNCNFVTSLCLTEAYNLHCELAACHMQQMDLSTLLPGSLLVHQALRVWHPFPNQNFKTAVRGGLLCRY